MRSRSAADRCCWAKASDAPRRSAAGVKIGTRLWFVTGDYLDTVARPARVRKALDAAREGWRNEQALRVQGNGKG